LVYLTEVVYLPYLTSFLPFQLFRQMVKMKSSIYPFDHERLERNKKFADEEKTLRDFLFPFISSMAFCRLDALIANWLFFTVYPNLLHFMWKKSKCGWPYFNFTVKNFNNAAKATLISDWKKGRILLGRKSWLCPIT